MSTYWSGEEVKDTESLRVRTAQLLHEAVDQVVEGRRSSYVAPEYPADMSVLNRLLDDLLGEEH